MENATLGANVKFKNKIRMRVEEFWDIDLNSRKVHNIIPKHTRVFNHFMAYLDWKYYTFCGWNEQKQWCRVGYTSNFVHLLNCLF